MSVPSLSWPPEVPAWPPTPGPRPVQPAWPTPVPQMPVDDDRELPRELAERLLDRRVVLVTGHLDGPLATEAAARVMLLDGTGDEPMELHLSCPSGDLDAALMLADTLDLVGVEVVALVRGSLGGAALAPYVVASRRLAHPHATFVLAEPRVSAGGRIQELTAAAARHTAQLGRLQARIAEATGRELAAVAADLRSGRVLSADEAVGYGLVTELVRPRGRR